MLHSPLGIHIAEKEGPKHSAVRDVTHRPGMTIKAMTQCPELVVHPPLTNRLPHGIIIMLDWDPTRSFPINIEIKCSREFCITHLIWLCFW